MQTLKALLGSILVSGSPYSYGMEATENKQLSEPCTCTDYIEFVAKLQRLTEDTPRSHQKCQETGEGNVQGRTRIRLHVFLPFMIYSMWWTDVLTNRQNGQTTKTTKQQKIRCTSLSVIQSAFLIYIFGGLERGVCVESIHMLHMYWFHTFHIPHVPVLCTSYILHSFIARWKWTFWIDAKFPNFVWNLQKLTEHFWLRRTYFHVGLKTELRLLTEASSVRQR